MLTPDQEKYLLTISEEKEILIQPFNPKAKETGINIVHQIQSKMPDLQVHFGGSCALGIAGQNDIDLNALSVPEEHTKYLPLLIELFGAPTKKTPNLVKWEFQKNGFDVELYLTDRNSPALQEHIKTFELIRDNPEYRQEYEQIKLSSNGLPFRGSFDKPFKEFITAI